MDVWGRYLVRRDDVPREVQYLRAGRAIFLRGPSGPLFATEDHSTIVLTDRVSGERRVHSSLADGFIVDNPCEEECILGERTQTVFQFDVPEPEQVTDRRHAATGRAATHLSWAGGQLTMTFDAQTTHLLRLESPSLFIDFQQLQLGSNLELRRQMDAFLRPGGAAGRW